jgi:hypothetical protein
MLFMNKMNLKPLSNNPKLGYKIILSMRVKIRSFLIKGYLLVKNNKDLQSALSIMLVKTIPVIKLTKIHKVVVIVHTFKNKKNKSKKKHKH